MTTGVPATPAHPAVELAPGAAPPLDGTEEARSPADRAAERAADRASLDRSFVHGVAWTGAVKWAVQLITWPVTLWTAKLLSPADYGFLAVVGTLTRFLALVTEGGIGTAIVTNPGLGDRQMRQLHALSTLAGLAAMALSALLAWPIATFSGNADSGWVLIAFSASLLLDAWMLVPSAGLRREFRYRDLALLEAARSLVTLGLTLLFAYRGWGYWALVAGHGLGTLVQALATLVVRHQPMAVPRLRELAPTLRVSLQLLTRNVGEFLSANSDRLIGARFVGTTALGHYSFAGILAFTPSDKITSMVTRVAPALFGRVRDDHAETSRYVLRITEAVSLVTLPAFVGMALIADRVVAVVLGPQWEGVVAPLRILCLYAAVIDCLIVAPHALTAVGDVRLLAQNGVIALVAYPPLFLLLGATLGTSGLALAWLLVGPLLALRVLLALRRKVGLSLRAYAASLGPAVTGVAGMAGVVVLADRGLDATALRPWLQLALVMLAGAVGYAVTTLLLHRGRVLAVAQFVRRMRQGGVA